MPNTRILIIDDEESILNLVGTLLECRGFEVHRSPDAIGGLELVAALRPAVVVLDYMMPGMDGKEALLLIKERFPDTYVIMFTGKGNEEIAVELMKAGASDYLIKPFSNKNLVDRIENVLKIREVEIRNRDLMAEREELLRKISAWNEELELRIKEESEALKKAHEEVVQSQKLATLGYLTAGMAHEIRNPLNSIALFTQIIKEGVDEADRLECADKIHKEVDRIDATLRKLLDTARRPLYELTEVAVDEVATKALDSFAPQIRTHGITLKYRAGKELPLVKADPAELQQIFTNLLLNAIDEMPDGGILRLELHEEDGELVILVSDSGRGIPQENLSSIFDPFFSTKQKGTGMGLPVVLRIVKSYGGRIEVQSASGTGATFLVRIPVNHQI